MASLSEYLARVINQPEQQNPLASLPGTKSDAGRRQGPHAPMGSGYNIGAVYPGIGSLGVSVMQSPDDGSGRILEFWPPDEPGDQSYPRPSGIPLKKPGVQLIGDKAKPLDIAGDIVSHYGVQNDPTLKAHYDQFAASLTPGQQKILHEQYAWARANEGEKRPFEQWKEVAGLPAYFRGYTFKQWPEKAYEHMYTPEQRAKLDEVVRYISQAR